MKVMQFYILGFLMVVSQLAAAQIEFKTSVSKNKLGINQRFRIEFTVNKQGADDFEPPSFTDFMWLVDRVLLLINHG